MVLLMTSQSESVALLLFVLLQLVIATAAERFVFVLCPEQTALCVRDDAV